MIVTISDLRAQPDFFECVADRIWQAWWKPHGVPLAFIRERLTQNLNDEPVPTALIPTKATASSARPR